MKENQKHYNLMHLKQLSYSICAVDEERWDGGTYENKCCIF
ncbi:hypothetical protein [Clostridium sp. DFI.1.208]|nr:hypothetical protein [Clostridium sp. DFI.1.208]